MRNIIVVFVFFLTSTPIFAQNMVGLGAAPCREILPYMDSISFQSQIFAWATGFLTGVNISNQLNSVGQREFIPLKKEQIIDEIREKCTSSPNSPLISTIEPMYLALTKER